jgi:hypothetical protein
MCLLTQWDSSLGAREMEGHTRESFLKIDIFYVYFDCSISLVLKELSDGLVNFIAKHFLSINSLLIVCLAIVIHISSDNVVSDEGTLSVFRVQERKISFTIKSKVMDHSCKLVSQLKWFAVYGSFTALRKNWRTASGEIFLWRNRLILWVNVVIFAAIFLYLYTMAATKHAIAIKWSDALAHLSYQGPWWNCWVLCTAFRQNKTKLEGTPKAFSIVHDKLLLKWSSWMCGIRTACNSWDKSQSFWLTYWYFVFKLIACSLCLWWKWCWEVCLYVIYLTL